MSKRTLKHLNVRLSALAVASCLGALPVAVEAAGMGRITVQSALGQVLQAEIEVSASKEELLNMSARMATPDAFKAVGLDFPTALTSFKLKIDKRANGEPIIRLTSDRPVSEPFIDMLVELNWSSGRLMREYTFLLDPPEAVKDVPTNVPEAAPSEAAPVAAVVPAAAEAEAEAPAEAPAEAVPAIVPVAEAEQPAAAEEAKESASKPDPSGVHHVKYGDYLTKIVRDIKPEGVTLDQMLVAVFRANPDAFQANNMNRLKTGKILTIPGAEQLAAVTAADAHKEVKAQARDWNAYRSRLAAAAAQEKPVAADAAKESAGKVVAKVEDKTPVTAPTKDQVKVSKTEAPAAGVAAAGAKQAEEEKVAREKALKESAERAAQLEKSVADLQKLAELKNKALADAQKQATPPAPAKPADAKPAETKPTEAAKPADAKPADAKPADAKPAAKPADAVKPKAPPPPPPPVEEEEDILANPAIWAGLLALLAGVGGLVYSRRRKAAKNEESPSIASSIADSSLGANSVFRATGGQSVDTSNATPAVTDFSQTGPGTIDTDEVDPVAEAEVYMAYGRDAQAEEILLEALQKDPKRLAIHLKLLEIYAQRKSAKQFETLSTELYSLTGGEGADWDKAAAMGAKLDPANPLYHGKGSGPGSGGGAAASFNPDATMVASRPAEQATKSTVVQPGAFAQMASQAKPPEMDFNLGLTAEPASMGGMGGSAGAMSFDLDLGAAAAPSLPEFSGAESDIASNAFSPEGTYISSSLAHVPAPARAESGPLAVDISFDLPGASTAVAGEREKPVSSDNAGGLDFDLGFGTSSSAATPSNGVVDIGAGDSGGIDFDVQLSSSGFEPAAANKPDMSSINLDLGASDGGGEADFAKTMFVSSDEMSANMGGDSTEVATKLDLAKAYEEMGDPEGARELLREVLAEGSAAQKDAANAIMARLA